jgi:hypothetical protein
MEIFNGRVDWGGNWDKMTQSGFARGDEALAADAVAPAGMAGIIFMLSSL